SARRTPSTRRPGRSAVTSRSRCRTTSCTARTHPRQPSARSRSGSRMRSKYPEYVASNVESWTRNNANFGRVQAPKSWAREEIDWGVFGVPESEVRALGDVGGLDVLDLGCGTGYLSAQLARLGARPVGIDPTPAQLETAREMQAEFELEFPLVEG